MERHPPHRPVRVPDPRCPRVGSFFEHRDMQAGDMIFTVSFCILISQTECEMVCVVLVEPPTPTHLTEIKLKLISKQTFREITSLIDSLLYFYTNKFRKEVIYWDSPLHLCSIYLSQIRACTIPAPINRGYSPQREICVAFLVKPKARHFNTALCSEAMHTELASNE